MYKKVEICINIIVVSLISHNYQRQNESELSAAGIPMNLSAIAIINAML